MDDRVVVSLLRHGLTPENEKGAYIGWTDSSLSTQGIEDTMHAKKTIHQTDRIYASSLMRCQETANILFPHRKIHLLDELRELHFGDWEGKTYKELKDTEKYRNWLDYIFTVRPNGGESFEEFSSRVQIGWEKVRQDVLLVGASNITIITHGGVIRYLLSVFSEKKDSFFDWKVPHVGGYQITWEKDAFRRRGKCISLQVVPITESPIG